MKKFLSALTLASATLTALAGNYNFRADVPDVFDGKMAYLVNYDTGDKIDSIMVVDSNIYMRGYVAEPLPVRLVAGGTRMGQFILEDCDINFDPVTRVVEGGKLNAMEAEYDMRVQELSDLMKVAETDEAQEEIYSRYQALADSVMDANRDNPIGYLVFMERAYDLEPNEYIEFLNNYPEFKKYTRVEKLLEANENKLATSEGAKFVDFEIEYDGVKHKLSDVVGKGDYVLVDFWASWCGPCIRETAVLKDIYKEYGNDLKVLGIAVWDEPEDTKKAIETHELPWECWINGQTIPTDIYGISGIPCIILFGPDGTILSRDRLDDDLRAAVAVAMEAKRDQKKENNERIVGSVLEYINTNLKKK